LHDQRVRAPGDAEVIGIDNQVSGIVQIDHLKAIIGGNADGRYEGAMD
jgi:hypothetical protein